MAGNDGLIKSFGEGCQLWSATLQQTQPASDVISDKVVSYTHHARCIPLASNQTNSSLCGNIFNVNQVLLYFSAHWCGRK
jgi:hypothetical protein